LFKYSNQSPNIEPFDFLSTLYWNSKNASWTGSGNALEPFVVDYDVGAALMESPRKEPF